MNTSSKVLLGLAAGIAVTAVAALLIEPEDVEKYRKKAYKKGKKLWKKTKESSADIAENIKDKVSDITEKVIHDGKELLS